MTKETSDTPDDGFAELMDLTDGPWHPASSSENAWHYTTAAGLLGILEANRIWASAPQVLNDESEVLYGVNVVRQALHELIRNEKLPSRYHGYLRRVVDDSWVESMQSKIFVASASRSGDLLNQWRHYANADGFAVGFQTGGSWGTRAVLAKDGRPSSDGIPTVFTPVLSGWYRVIYNQSKQLRQARNALLFATHRPFGASDKWYNNEAEWPSAVGHTRLLLSGIPIMMKHPAFSDEREMRYIGGATDGEVRFRAAGGRVVPYTTVGVTSRVAVGEEVDGQFPIGDVVCGPGCRPGTPDVVRRALKSFGYDGVRVTTSGVPYIGS